jgi:hypothetical protein
MRRLFLSTLLALGLSCAIQPAFAATAQISQSGNYTLTVVRQYGDRSRTIERVITESQYETWRAASARKAEMLSRLSTSNAFSRGCSGMTQSANSTAIAQSGTGNIVATHQTGANNSIAIAQHGSSNAAYTVQAGQNFAANTVQSGDYNIAFVVQFCR